MYWLPVISPTPPHIVVVDIAFVVVIVAFGMYEHIVNRAIVNNYNCKTNNLIQRASHSKAYLHLSYPKHREHSDTL